MNSDQQIPEPHDEHEDTEHEDASPGSGHESGRPFGFWLKLVDRRISEEMEALFAEDGLTRRDWRVLNLLAGEANDEYLTAKLQAKPGLVHDLAERGWVEGMPPTLTAAGREALERLTERVDALRARIAGAVSPEDFAATLATLEAVARELGWDESPQLPRGHRGGRGFGRRGFGRFGWSGRGAGRPGFDPREHFGPSFDPRDHFRHGFDPREHFGHPEHDPRDGRGHRGHAPREHCGPEAGFDPHMRGRFGGRERFAGHGRPRQDVHVHVHVHEERGGRKHPRPEGDA